MEDGFTRLELLAVIGGVVLLGCVALPVLAASRGDAQRIACVNNLRQIGQGFAGWGNEHGDSTPAWVDWSYGGVRNNPLRQSAWLHFSVLSNHMATPKVLACPANPFGRIAIDWSNLPERGLIPPAGLGDRAVSYLIGLHCLPDYPMELLSGDSYFQRGLGRENCTAQVSANTITLTDSEIGWFKAESHFGLGNLLLKDGRVLQTTSDELRAYLRMPGKYNSAHVHFLNPAL